MQSNYLSRLGSAIERRVLRSVTWKENATLDKIYIMTGHGKMVRPGIAAIAAQANVHIANGKRNLSVFGSFSRAFSIPSVSGPSFQVCGYHVDCLLSKPSQGDLKSEKELMAICGSRSTLTDSSISNLMARPQTALAACHSFCSYRIKVWDNHKIASTSMRSKEQCNNFLLAGSFMYNNTKRKGSATPFLGFGFKDLHISSTACFSAGTCRDLSFDNSKKEEQYRSSADSSDLNTPIDRALKLNSGSCYLPHPDKEETGGEDAHFICESKHAIGVADGVGGWADVGIDAGVYARELMSNSVNAIQEEEQKGPIDPARVLEKAYTSTKAKGSSTACIIALTEQGLHAINLGDSGFLVVRDGCTVFRSPVQQHDFNFTYQLECGHDGDLPSSGQVFKIPVAPGDVIIAGTDGLFDNLYNSDITGVVVHATRAGFGPQVTAQKIAALARQRALDKNRQTPFSTAAQEAGFRYYGGKLDDITVIVSYIASDHNESLSTNNSN